MIVATNARTKSEPSSARTSQDVSEDMTYILLALMCAALSCFVAYCGSCCVTRTAPGCVSTDGARLRQSTPFSPSCRALYSMVCKFKTVHDDSTYRCIVCVRFSVHVVPLNYTNSQQNICRYCRDKNRFLRLITSFSIPLGRYLWQPLQCSLRSPCDPAKAEPGNPMRPP